MLTRKQLIDTIEGYDAEIEALQQSKRETYDEHRANLLGNMGKDQVRDEIDALKKAVQRRRQIAKHGVQVVEDKDALVEEILAEVEARVARGASAREIIEEFPSADPTHVAADQSTGNVDGSAGRSHSDPRLSTESPASVPVDTNSHLQHDAGDRADPDPHSLVGSSNSHLQDDLGDQAGAAAAGLSNTCDMRRDSLKPVGLSIGAADIPHEGQIH